MGKDKAEMSKEDLAQENERLSGEVRRVQQGLEEVDSSLKKTAEAYEQSKAAFSLSRYGHLKVIIKKLISDEFMSMVHSLTESGRGGGSFGLLQKAREFAIKEGAEPNDQPPPPASKSGGGGGGKLSSFFKKIKQATGFSDDADPQDVRVLDKDEIRRDNERKKRELRRLSQRSQLALTALHKLRERYHASKKHAPPKRYQDLKDMIKDVLSEQI